MNNDNEDNASCNLSKKGTNYLKIINYTSVEDGNIFSLYAKVTTGNPSGDAGTVMSYNVKIMFLILNTIK